MSNGSVFSKITEPSIKLTMKILLLEPYYGGSHRQWAEGLMAHSEHDIYVYSLPDSHWKWRMHGAAVSFATRFMEDDVAPDLILCSDMLDLSTFLGLTGSKSAGVKTAIYFHENQLSYPWSPTDQDVDKHRDNHYKYINYTSALAADKVFFNSAYHLDSFFEALDPFLSAFPDHQNSSTVEAIKRKSSVLSLGLDLQNLDAFRKDKETDLPILLWNHRWEYDKNPELFFNTLIGLKDEGLQFRLIVIGKAYKKSPKIFKEAKAALEAETLHFGYVDSMEEYAALLWQADILPVTSNQDFFGGSIVEAMYCDCVPLLPNRLTYPGHVGTENVDKLYNTDVEFREKLRTLILDKTYSSKSLRHKVEGYDWSQLIAIYDKNFTQGTSVYL